MKYFDKKAYIDPYWAALAGSRSPEIMSGLKNLKVLGTAIASKIPRSKKPSGKIMKTVKEINTIGKELHPKSRTAWKESYKIGLFGVSDPPAAAHIGQALTTYGTMKSPKFTKGLLASQQISKILAGG
jgi:hypothetical protein